jgi:drug/metabolite transporter (DMT)-like permease
MFSFLVGVKIIGATRAAIVSTLEPVVGATLAVLVLGEQPTWLKALGGMLVILAALLVSAERRAPEIGMEGASEGPH